MCQISQLKSFGLGYFSSSMIMCVHNLHLGSCVPTNSLKIKETRPRWVLFKADPIMLSKIMIKLLWYLFDNPSIVWIWLFSSWTMIRWISPLMVKTTCVFKVALTHFFYAKYKNNDVRCFKRIVKDKRCYNLCITN